MQDEGVPLASSSFLKQYILALPAYRMQLDVRLHVAHAYIHSSFLVMCFGLLDQRFRRQT